MSVEYLFYNARIWAGPELPEMKWMIFNSENGYITQIGSESAPLDRFKSNLYDMKGKRILPGFNEAHIHISEFGEQLKSLNLGSCENYDDLKMKLSEHVRLNNERHEEMIICTRFNDIDIGRMITKEDLDAICSTIPIVVFRICLHACIFNSAALEKYGINNETTDLGGGTMERYPKDHPLHNQINGVLRECFHFAAKHLTNSAFSKVQKIKTALNYCLERGVTSVQTIENDTWNEYCHMAEDGELPIRVFYVHDWVGCQSKNAPDKAGDSCGDMLSCDRVKLFLDGSIGGKTAALYTPYKGCDDNKGVLMHSQEAMNDLVSLVTSHGYQLEMHVIGDRAVDQALAALKFANVSHHKRPVFVHCQIIRDDQICEMKRYGVIASIQPQFVVTDPVWFKDVLPDDIWKYSYRWKTLNDNGVMCIGGSDAPVEDPVPLIGMYDAIFRQTSSRSDDSTVFSKEECLSFDEALSLYTINAAHAARKENSMGLLKPGYVADFIVIASDLDIRDHPKELKSAIVEQVWVNGDCKFSL